MRVCFVLTVALVCAGCGGATLRGNYYSDDESSFHFGSLPKTWQMLEVSEDNDLAWQHGPSGALIQVNASCRNDLDIPLTALRNHLLMGFTERDFQSEERVMIDQREALQSELKAKLDGQPRQLVLVVLKKDGCVYDFALIASPAETFGALKQDLQTLLSGFDA